MDASDALEATTPAEAGDFAHALALAFPFPLETARILTDAGLDAVMLTAKVAEPEPWPRWFDIVVKVRDRAGIERLLTVALKELPDNADLMDALDRASRRMAPAQREPQVPPSPAVGAVPRRPPVIRPRRRLIDRVDVVEVMRSEMATAATNQVGSRLLLLGDSGVGKTRLAEEGMQLADELGMAVLVARCVDQNAEPLLPLRDGLGQFRQDTPVRDLLMAGGQPLLDYAPFLESFLGTGGPQAAATPLGGSSSQGVYDGLAQVLIGLAEQSGLCLVVDDLADADRDTVSFLGYLGRKAAASRLVAIMTVREDLIAPDLTDLIDSWRIDGCLVSPVPPLAEQDAAEFITLVRDDQPVAAEWIDEVLGLTAGNPFFIEQVVGLTAGSQEPAPTLAEVPDRIDAVVKRRLRRLEGDVRLFLEAAAVALDVTQRLELVAHVAGVDVDTASSRLGQALTRRYLTEDAQGHIGFAQKLVQRVLHDEIAPHERTRLNLRAAEWLEREGLLASASYHYDTAGRTEDLLRTALSGAEQAEHAGMYATAVQLYLRARPVGDDVSIGLRLARDYLVLGAWAEAEGVLAALPPDLGEARVLRSDLHFVRGSFDRALRELRLAAQDPAVDRTKALVRLVDIHLYLGRLRKAIDLATEGLADTTDPTDRATLKAGIGTCLYHLGDLAGAEEAYLEELRSLPEAVEQRDRFAYTVALHNLALAREAHGDWAGAKRFHQEALQLRLDVSAAREVGHSRHSLVRCEIALGAFDTARQLLTEARAAAIALGEELEQGKLDHTEAQLELLTGG